MRHGPLRGAALKLGRDGALVRIAGAVEVRRDTLLFGEVLEPGRGVVHVVGAETDFFDEVGLPEPVAADDLLRLGTAGVGEGPMAVG